MPLLLLPPLPTIIAPPAALGSSQVAAPADGLPRPSAAIPAPPAAAAAAAAAVDTAPLPPGGTPPGPEAPPPTGSSHGSRQGSSDTLVIPSRATEALQGPLIGAHLSTGSARLGHYLWGATRAEHRCHLEIVCGDSKGSHIVISAISVVSFRTGATSMYNIPKSTSI